MRVRFPETMSRWWKEGNGHGNGHGRRGAAATAPAAGAAEDRSIRPHGNGVAHDSVEPPWFAQRQRAGIPQTLNYTTTTTLGRILDHAADRFGELPAVIYNDKRWTYRELLTQANRMAGGLARLGVRQGDYVLTTLPNCPEYVASFFAIQKLGAVLVNAGPLMGTDDLHAAIALTRPRAMIGLDLHAAPIARAATAAAKDGATVEHFVWITLQCYQPVLRRLGYQIKLWQGRERSTGGGGGAQHISLDKLLHNAPAKPPTTAPPVDATAVLQPTSGTTGSLKLAQLSHRNLLANAVQVAAWMSAREGQERVLAILPMFHSYGLTMGLIQPVFSAASMVLVTRFDAAQVVELLERERPTIFPMVPAICHALCDEIERRGEHLAVGSIRACISGAAPLPKELAERFERLTGGARVVEGYGLSECSPVTHSNLASRPRYGTIGLPMPDTVCRVVDLDDETREVPVGQPGELLVSGPQVMSGYFRNPGETSRALLKDTDGRTWLRTGDVVRMDEDGFFQVMDRRKDMIIRSGLKVYPAKVEHVLAAHPRVAGVAVIGRAEPLHTEEVVAFVVLKSPSVPASEQPAMADELRAHCRDHLAAYEVPSVFEFVEQIPRSALGKVLKKELRRLLVATTAAPEKEKVA